MQVLQFTPPSSVPAGAISLFAGAVAPAGWLLCNGASISRTTYATLLGAIGTTFGSADGAHFNLPDLRGRVPLGVGQGTGLSNRTLGQKSGEESHLLNTTELPAHQHPQLSDTSQGSGPYVNPAIRSNAAAPGFAQAFFTGNTGGSQPHNNMPPFLGLNFIIKT